MKKWKRNYCYKQALEQVLREQRWQTACSGLCHNLANTRYVKDRDIWEVLPFPEFWKQKPPNANPYWWGYRDYESRIEVLKICIKQTETELTWKQWWYHNIGYHLRKWFTQ